MNLFAIVIFILVFYYAYTHSPALREPSLASSIREVSRQENSFGLGAIEGSFTLLLTHVQIVDPT